MVDEYWLTISDWFDGTDGPGLMGCHTSWSIVVARRLGAKEGKQLKGHRLFPIYFFKGQNSR
jgi:hypothetical protein